MNELYVDKLISLVKAGLITIEDIKNEEYKTEVKRRLV